MREARGARAAERIAGLKKVEMATVAEGLLATTGWVPEPLRTPGQVFTTQVDPDAGPAPDGEVQSAADGGEPAIASEPAGDDTDDMPSPTAAIAAE